MWSKKEEKRILPTDKTLKKQSFTFLNIIIIIIIAIYFYIVTSPVEI